MLISIIMRTKNSESTVAEALQSLFQQQQQDFELIVMDSGSTDETLTILKDYPHQRIDIAPEDYFPGKVLNQAAKIAQGEYLVFQNSDVVLLNDGALDALIAPLIASQSVQASFARQLPRPEAHDWVKADYAKAFPEVDSPAWMHYSLPFAAMRKSAWEQRPFYTWAWGSEDTEWGQRQRNEEGDESIVYTPLSCVMHSHNYTLPQIYGRRFIEGEANAYMARHHNPSSVSVATQSVLRAFKSALQDVSNPLQFPLAISRRAMWEWGHWKGWCQGKARMQKPVAHGANYGQRVVLKTHESR